MKITKFTAVALFASLLMIGCASEGLDNGGNIENNTSKGKLSIEALTIDCRIDESDPDVGVLSKKSTRSEVVVDNFDCSIINGDNEVVLSNSKRAISSSKLFREKFRRQRGKPQYMGPLNRLKLCVTKPPHSQRLSVR